MIHIQEPTKKVVVKKLQYFISNRNDTTKSVFTFSLPFKSERE